MVADPVNELFFNYNNSMEARRSAYRTNWLIIWSTTNIALLGAAFDPSYISTIVRLMKKYIIVLLGFIQFIAYPMMIKYPDMDIIVALFNYNNNMLIRN